MSVGVEIVPAERWLFQTLNAAGITGVGSRIYGYRAPQGVADPFVVFQNQTPGAGDLNALGAVRIWTEIVYLVRAVKKTTSWSDAVGSLEVAADGIDAAISFGRGGVSDGYVDGCTREGPFSMVEEENGVQFRHLGGLYRLHVRGT